MDFCFYIYYNTSMLDFLFILLIFLEIATVYFIIIKCVAAENQIKALNSRISSIGIVINDIHLKIQKNIHSINKVVSLFTSQKFFQIKKIIGIILSAIEVIIILKSFNFSKGVKFNIKNIKKLLFAGATKQIMKKIFQHIELLCR